MWFRFKQTLRTLAILPVLSATGCDGLPDSIFAKSKSKSNVPIVNLEWQDFYQLPVGPRGLEPTQKLLAVADKKVRLRGYMVQEEEPESGVFLLAPLPVSLAEKEDGPADDLPPTTVYVHLPTADQHKTVDYRPGLWELEGKLVLGNQEEVGGRVSYTRLLLD